MCEIQEEKKEEEKKIKEEPVEIEVKQEPKDSTEQGNPPTSPVSSRRSKRIAKEVHEDVGDISQTSLVNWMISFWFSFRASKSKHVSTATNVDVKLAHRVNDVNFNFSGAQTSVRLCKQGTSKTSVPWSRAQNGGT